MKKLILIGVLAGISWSALAGQTYEVRPGVPCLILRKKSTYHSRALDCLPARTEVRVLRRSSGNGYSYVQVGNQRGYMWTGYMRKAKGQVADRAVVSTVNDTPTGAPSSKDLLATGEPSKDVLKAQEQAFEPTKTSSIDVPKATPTEMPSRPSRSLQDTLAMAGTRALAPTPSKPSDSLPPLSLLPLPKSDGASPKQSDEALLPPVNPPAPLAPVAAPEHAISNDSPSLPPQPPAAIKPDVSPASVISVESKSKSSSGECQFSDAIMQKNCLSLIKKVNAGELPKQATLFALKTFKEVTGSYCGGKTISDKYRNKCSFFYSDLDGNYKGMAYKSPAFLIDLCAGDPKRSTAKNVVHATSTNRGTGTGSSRRTASYRDVPMAKQTLAGIFMTKELTGFNPEGSSNRARYRNLLGYREGSPKCDGVGNFKNGFLKSCGVIRLEVTRVNGARTDESKPMHTSPYSSSSGCPSLSQDENWIMRSLASRGNSLYIAYTAQKSQAANFDRSALRSCAKDPDTLPDEGGALSSFPGREVTSQR